MIKALIARPRLKFISVEKLPDIRANEGVGPSRKINYKMSLMME